MTIMSLYTPPPDTHNKHSNIQYHFLTILPSPTPHNKHSNIQYTYIATHFLFVGDTESARVCVCVF
jgi:hypothetical protein